MNCPKCKSSAYVKSGFIRGVAHKKCKSCRCHFTRSDKHGKPLALKRQALQLYLEGLGFRAIGRCLGVSNVSVLNWIRHFGMEVVRLSRAPTKVAIAELDDMHSYIGNKKRSNGYGLLLIDWANDTSMVLSARGTQAPVKGFGGNLNIN